MEYLQNFWNEYGPGVVSFLIALGFLLAFYIVARIIRSLIARVMNKTDIDNKFVETVGLPEDFPIEKVLANTVFWIVMTYGILTFFDKLQLQTVAHPINRFLTEIMEYLPKVGAALGLLVVAWVLAALVKIGISKGANFLSLDAKLNELDEDRTTDGTFTIENSLANAGYWFVFLLFLPLILGTLQLQSLIAPLQDMFSKVFQYLPNIFSAGLILLVGIFVARIVRKIISSLLGATGVNQLSSRAGLNLEVSTLVGTLAYTVILLLTIVQSLDALQIAAISAPASRMIEIIFTSVPGILAAILVLVVSYHIGKLLAGLVTDMLNSVDFNGMVAKTELLPALSSEDASAQKPSEYVGWLVLVGVILFAVLGATELLNFAPLSAIVTQVINFSVHVLLGALILGIGILVARKVREVVSGSGLPPAVSGLAYAAVLVLSTAMALRQIGLAEDIINLAFGIGFGAIGLGAAIAIGLGSHKVVEREVESFIDTVKK